MSTMHTSGVEEVVAYSEGNKSLESTVDFLLNSALKNEKLSEEEQKEDGRRYDMYEVWKIISDSALKIPFTNHQRVLRLCEEIRQRKVPISDSLRKDFWHWESYFDQTEKEEIAFLLLNFRECLNYVELGSLEYINMSGFTSQMTMYDTIHPLGDYTLHGFWMIRDALEEPKSIQELIQTQTVGKLEAVRVWLFYAGSRMYKGVLANETFPDRCGIMGDGFIGQLDENTKGLTKPRWELWRTRLNQVCESDLASTQQKEKCKGIIDAMDHSELVIDG